VPDQREPYPWKILIALVAAGILGVLCLLPYASSLLRGRLPPSPFSASTLVLIQFVQSAVLLIVATAIGLQLAESLTVRPERRAQPGVEGPLRSLTATTPAP